jgi:hypothetical protein
MNGSFSGKVSLEEKEVKPHKHSQMIQDSSDLRINVLQEYILKVPSATVHNLKTALNHFGKATEEEFKELVKLANIDKYNELFGQKSLPTHIEINQTSIRDITIYPGSKLLTEEIDFIDKHPHLKGNEIFILYKQQFPNSMREERFIRDSRSRKRVDYISSINNHKLISNYTEIPDSSNKQDKHQLTIKTIRSLYKAGFSKDVLPKVKPIINALILQNINQDELEFAIEYLKL